MNLEAYIYIYIYIYRMMLTSRGKYPKIAF